MIPVMPTYSWSIEGDVAVLNGTFRPDWIDPARYNIESLRQAHDYVVAHPEQYANHDTWLAQVEKLRNGLDMLKAHIGKT